MRMPELNLFYLIHFFSNLPKVCIYFSLERLTFCFLWDIYRQNSFIIIFTQEQYFHSMNMVVPFIHFVIMQCLQQQTTTLSLGHKIFLLTSLSFMR